MGRNGEYKNEIPCHSLVSYRLHPHLLHLFDCLHWRLPPRCSLLPPLFLLPRLLPLCGYIPSKATTVTSSFVLSSFLLLLSRIHYWYQPLVCLLHSFQLTVRCRSLLHHRYIVLILRVPVLLWHCRCQQATLWYVATTLVLSAAGNAMPKT